MIERTECRVRNANESLGESPDYLYIVDRFTDKGVAIVPTVGWKESYIKAVAKAMADAVSSVRV